MTIEEARTLRKGDRIACHEEHYKIRRISFDPWHSSDDTIVRVSCLSWHGGEWFSPEKFVVVPERATMFLEKTGEWVRKATKRQQAKTGKTWIPVGQPIQPSSVAS